MEGVSSRVSPFGGDGEKFTSEDKARSASIKSHDYTVGDSFERIGIKIAMIRVRFMSAVSGSSAKPKLENLKARLSHLDSKRLESIRVKVYSGSLLVTSRNVMSQEVILHGTKHISEVDYQPIHSLSEEDYQPILSRSENGICAGGVLEFAEDIFKVGRMDSEAVKETASKFVEGMGVKAVATQIFYENTKIESNIAKSINNSLKNDKLTDNEKAFTEKFLRYITSLNRNSGKKLLEYISSKELDENEIRRLFPLVKDVMRDLQEIMKGTDVKKIPSKEILSIVNKYKKNLGPELEKVLSTFVKQYASRIDWRVRAPKVTIENESSNSINKSMSNLYAEKSIELNEKLISLNDDLDKGKIKVLKHINEGSQITTDRIKYVAKSIGLELTEKTTLVGLKNDEEILTEVSGFKPGLYPIEFYQAAGKHITLFINSGDKKYFWDPNIGLFDLTDKSPQSFIGGILNKYYKTPENLGAGNHGLKLFEITKGKEQL